MSLHRARAALKSRYCSLLIAAAFPIALATPQAAAEPGGIGEIKLREHPIELPHEGTPANTHTAPVDVPREGPTAPQQGNAIEQGKAPKPADVGSLPSADAPPGRPKSISRTDAVKNGLSDRVSQPNMSTTTSSPTGEYAKMPGSPDNAKPASASQYDKLPSQSQYGSGPPERENAKPASASQYDKLPAQSQYSPGPPERTNATSATNQYDKLPSQSQYGPGPPERTNATSATNQYDKLPPKSQYGSGPPERTNTTQYGPGPPERTNATSATSQYDKLPPKSQYDFAPKPKQ